MTKFALFGAGRIGKIHAENIARNRATRLEYIVDVNGRAAEELAMQFAAQAASADAALSDPSIDAVVIATATNTHYELIARSAAAGKAIFCEKPLDVDVSRSRLIAETVQQQQVPFFLAFNRRFDPHYHALHQALWNGTIGRPELVLITSRDADPPSREYLLSSGTIFRHMTIHEIDLFRWLTGEEPAEVYATGSCFVYPELESSSGPDTAVTTLKTASGVIGVINNLLRSAFGYDQRLEVQGEQGVLQVSNRDRLGLIKLNREGEMRSGPKDGFIDRFADAYRAELEAFIGQLRAGASMAPSCADGLRAAIIGECIERSCREGAPVKVPPA
jgi:myo-inositol 2-dehydrogenase/D-chiro-inositol 1-dehydrogenase